MKKLLFILFIICTIFSARGYCQTFVSDNDLSKNVCSVVSYGKMYEACSLGTTDVDYFYKTSTYVLTIGTDNRFDEPMSFTFENKEKLISTLIALRKVCDDGTSGEMELADINKTIVHVSFTRWPTSGVNISTYDHKYAGIGYIKKFDKIISKIENFNL